MRGDTSNLQAIAVPQRIHLSLWGKVLSGIAWGVGVGIFVLVGWMALEPVDPRGAVALITTEGATLVVLEVLALSAIVAGLATVLVGRRLPDAGVFAVAVGLAVANLRGATSAHLLIHVAGPDTAARSALAWKLAGEGLIWCLPVVTAMVVSGLVMCWLAHDGDDAGADRASWRDGALAEIPGLKRLLPGTDREQPAGGRINGLKACGLSFIAALVLFRLFATGSPLRSVQHGQTYFALVAAFYLAGWLAYRYFPVRTPLWGCLSVPLVMLAAYVVCALGSPPRGYDQVASVPPAAFFRALPIEYIHVGTAAAIAAFWSSGRLPAADAGDGACAARRG